MPKTPTDVAAAPADAMKTESGLASKVLQAGTGEEKPAAADTPKPINRPKIIPKIPPS